LDRALWTHRAVRPAGAEAARERCAVGAVEHRGGVLRDDRRVHRRRATADVEAAEAEVGQLGADEGGIQLPPGRTLWPRPRGGSAGGEGLSGREFVVPAAVVNDRCWRSGGGFVVVVVLVVVVVVVVVGTVRLRDSPTAKVSSTDSSGASWVGVPHALSAPLNDPAAFCPQASSTCFPAFTAFEKHFVSACSFLPIALSSLPKHPSGPGAPAVTIWIAFWITASTEPLTEFGSASGTRQLPFAAALVKPLLKLSVAFWRQASSTGTPFWSALA